MLRNTLTVSQPRKTWLEINDENRQVLMKTEKREAVTGNTSIFKPEAKPMTFAEFFGEQDESLIELTKLLKMLKMLTKSPVRLTTNKVLQAITEGISKAVNKENTPSEPALLLSVMSEIGKLLEGEISAQFATDNALELARLRGEASKLELLDGAGPMLTPAEVAEALGKTKQAVHKRLQSGSLFGMMNKGEFRIPAWQIREREVVPGIAQVLHNLDTTQWGKMLFLHSENMQLGGRRPMDLILAGEINLVAQVAASFGEEGAK
jgi:hypothetical protein